MSQQNHASHPAVTLSIRVPVESRDQLEDLSQATGRTKSFLAAEAIAHYLAIQNWQLKSIEAAVKKADSKNAKFIEHEKISSWLNSWGNEKVDQDPFE